MGLDVEGVFISIFVSYVFFAILLFFLLPKKDFNFKNLTIIIASMYGFSFLVYLDNINLLYLIVKPLAFLISTILIFLVLSYIVQLLIFIFGIILKKIHTKRTFLALLIPLGFIAIFKQKYRELEQ